MPSTRCRDTPTRLIAFSDDMDGLRKVPDNVPNQDMLAEYLGKPLTRIPDPFGTHESFAAHNNAMLRDFLDRYGFDYEFASSTDYYADGRFDEALKSVLRHYQAILDVMLPTLGADRRGDLFAGAAGLAQSPASCSRCRSRWSMPMPA